MEGGSAARRPEIDGGRRPPQQLPTAGPTATTEEDTHGGYKG